MALPRLTATLMALTLFAAACGDTSATDPTGPGQATTTTTVAPTTTSPIVTTTGATPPPSTLPPTTTTTVSPTTTTTTLPPGSPEGLPPILAAGPNGIEFLGGDQIVAPIPPEEPGEWVAAVDDGAGGLVYAAVGADNQTIWWWAPGGESQVISFKPGRALHDAAVIDGRPVAIVEDDPNAGAGYEPETYTQIIDLTTGRDAARLRQVGGIEWGAAQIDHANGVFLVTEVSHSCGDVYAFDLDGADVALPGLPEPACEVHFEVPFAGAAFAPDGASLVVLERHTEPSDDPGGSLAGTDLVLYRDGSEALRVPVAGPDVHVYGVDFDGRWAIVAGPFDGVGERGGDPIVVDTQAAEPKAITVAGNGAHSFRFLTAPLEVGTAS